MNKQELKDKIERRLLVLKTAQFDVDNAHQDYANLMCPYKVGGILVNNKGDKARLSRIEFASLSGIGFKLYGVKIKKDGSDYSFTTGLHGYQGWRKE